MFDPPYTRAYAQTDPVPAPRPEATTRVGSLGPYRGRLGVGWVIAPLVAGIIIVVAAVLLLR